MPLSAAGVAILRDLERDLLLGLSWREHTTPDSSFTFKEAKPPDPTEGLTHRIEYTLTLYKSRPMHEQAEALVRTFFGVGTGGARHR